MNVNMYIQRYTGGYELNSSAPVQDGHNVHIEGIRLCSTLVTIIYFEIQTCGCGGRPKVPAGQHHYQGSQSEKHPQPCSLAP